jgi:hypothetical protein
MDEGDLEAEHAVPRRLVDQLRTGLGQVRQCGADVVDLVRDVMHAGAPLRQEAAHRRVLGERSEQLEPALADADRGGLDALLLDARTLLEPGAEEALVRVERAVEILDRETDMMDRARRLHPAIVCERLAATMRVTALVLVLTTTLVAGCGGSKKTAKANGEASKPATQVLADAKAAADSASSVHVTGSITSNGTPITFDLSLASNGAKGSASIDGLRFGLVRIGNTAYIQGSDAFYKHFAGPTFAQLLHDKWVKASTSDKRVKSFAPLTRIGPLFARVGAHHGKLVNGGNTVYKGQQVVLVHERSEKSKLYVASTGAPYPVALLGGTKAQHGTITFGGWNSSVSLSAPKGAIDISQFGG